MQISFHGADRSVTGSCHLVQCGGKRVLVDCGMIQGGRELEEDNEAPFGFEARSVDYVLLTHAHLDHCGRLPLLVKRGFRGKVLATGATRDLCRLVLMDSARIQEEDAARQRRHTSDRRARREIQPLYGSLDVFDALERFRRPVRYGRTLKLTEGMRVTFLDAGHILGSASILFELEEGQRERRVLFSGDLGNRGLPLLRDLKPAPAADVVVMESTYGDRRHRALEPSVAELVEAVRVTFARGGNVLIPTFALERTQELLFFLRAAVERGELPEEMPVYLDSPMGISATEIYSRHPECYDRKVKALFASGQDPFDLPGLQFTRDVAESMAINSVRGGAIIMAGSGMCSGGRIRHHLRHNLERPECSVIFVGFAARGTLARLIIDGAQRVRLFGREMEVRAAIHTINGFSAHADQAELVAWHRGSGAKTTILVHGEEQAMETLATHLGPTHCLLPHLGEEFALE